MDFHRILDCITAAQREAGALMLSARDAVAEEKSGRRDVVTQYDRAVQALLMERLSAVDGAEFFCEELAEESPLSGECVFIIDPIDGTMNFLKGLNHSCISVACARGGSVMVGSVYNPYTDELFTAIRGEGAFLNGRPIHVTDAPLSGSIVHFGTSPYCDAVTEVTFALARRAYAAGLDVRRRGSAALDLCDVAAGRAGLYFEMFLSLWDYAAGALIVEEAGGVCTDMSGAPLPFDESKPSILAGNARTAAEFAALSKDI